MLSASVLSLGIASGSDLVASKEIVQRLELLEKTMRSTEKRVREQENCIALLSKIQGDITDICRRVGKVEREAGAYQPALSERRDCPIARPMRRSGEEIDRATEDNPRSKAMLSAFEKLPKETTSQILARLNALAVGNDVAKEDLADCLVRHYERCEQILRSGKEPKEPAERTFVIGESGSGKNFLIEELVYKSGFPIIQLDISSSTMSGYHGKKIEEELKRLKEEPLGEFAIVILNEFDKLSSKAAGPKDSVGGAAVQNQILTFLEGSADTGQFNPKNLFVIAAGAFSHVNRNGRKELTKTELIEEGGLSREVVGRFSLVQLDSPSEQTLLDWLNNPNQPFQCRQKELLDRYKIEIKFQTPELIPALAKRLSRSLNKTNFRHANDVIKTAFLRIGKVKRLERSLVEAFKNIPDLVLVEEQKDKTIITIKNIDFFVKEEIQKTAEEKLSNAIKTDDYRQKVDLLALELQARKDAEEVVKKRESVEFQLKRRTEEAEIELQARKKAELKVEGWLKLDSLRHQITGPLVVASISSFLTFSASKLWGKK